MQRFLLASIVLLCWSVFGAIAQATTLEDEARSFLVTYEEQATKINRETQLVQWAYDVNITDENAKALNDALETFSEFQFYALKNASRFFQNMESFHDATIRRKLQLLRLTGSDPWDAQVRQNFSNTKIAMSAVYSTGKACIPDGLPDSGCHELDPSITRFMSKNRNFDSLRAVWKSWSDNVGLAVRQYFPAYVELSNKGAQDYGFKDAAELWTSGYDMPSQDFMNSLEDAWKQLLPLYTQLHCYVRQKLSQYYGKDKVPLDQPIPIHVMGNMWGQTWSSLLDIVIPFKEEPAIDVSDALKNQGYDAIKLMKLGESFYRSLGFEPLPSTFWNDSMMTRPPNRAVVCHASAWDLEETAEGIPDIRIKMCVDVGQEDLYVIHHEQGHLFYYQSYHPQSYLFRGSANDGFHEAIGDTTVLSTRVPKHLADIGLFPPEQANLNHKGWINYLMSLALDTVAFLPFGYIVDQWRWKVFQGKITPENYNSKWWELVAQYQGLAPGVPRNDTFLDAANKFHVADSTPYMRYFLAAVLKFQFHRALCKEAGHTGPLHECSIYNNTQAGARFKEMLALGLSKPWQEALHTISGETKLDAGAVVEFFGDLLRWLEEQNQGQVCGLPGSNTQNGNDDGGSGRPPIWAAVLIAIAIVIGVFGGLYWCRKQAPHADIGAILEPLVTTDDTFIEQPELFTTPITSAKRASLLHASENDGL